MHEFKVWGPAAQRVQVQLADKALPMEGPNSHGWWKLCVPEAECGADYAFLIDDDTTPYPDPRSMHQPSGVHGLSRLYSHKEFAWTDQRWQGPPVGGAILYEMHIGTFSDSGTFDGAVEHLDHLAELGVTHVEVMPVADFAGEFGWGYDGVGLYAVSEPYGGPDGLKRFVDACHAKDLAVVMDVVYNHFGPVGNYTNKFGPYLTEKHKTPWGAAVNFDEGGSDEVRGFFCENAQMWLRDYHVDGLRLDATHEFHDRGAVPFMEQLSAEVERLGAVLGRKLILIAESDLNDPKFVRPREAGGFGMDAQWSDDFHHSLFTLIYDKEPGKGYYDDFGTMEQLVKTLKEAFCFTGDYSKYRKHTHGRPVGNLSAHHFIGYIQNHDQVGNRAEGERLHHLTDLDTAKVGLGLTMMAAFLPMIFMGEEFASSSPFLYFADNEDPEMRRLVAEGRKKDFALFFGDIEVPDPGDRKTFERSKLKWDEVHEGIHEEMFAWTKNLTHLRRKTVALNDGDLGHTQVDYSSDARTLTMQRGPVRTFVNLGKEPGFFKMKDGEEMVLASRAGVAPKDGSVELPAMTLVVVQLQETSGE